MNENNNGHSYSEEPINLGGSDAPETSDDFGEGVDEQYKPHPLSALFGRMVDGLADIEDRRYNILMGEIITLTPKNGSYDSRLTIHHHLYFVIGENDDYVLIKSFMNPTDKALLISKDDFNIEVMKTVVVSAINNDTFEVYRKAEKAKELAFEVIGDLDAVFSRMGETNDDEDDGLDE